MAFKVHIIEQKNLKKAKKDFEAHGVIVQKKYMIIKIGHPKIVGRIKSNWNFEVI